MNKSGHSLLAAICCPLLLFAQACGVVEPERTTILRVLDLAVVAGPAANAEVVERLSCEIVWAELGEDVYGLSRAELVISKTDRERVAEVLRRNEGLWLDVPLFGEWTERVRIESTVGGRIPLTGREKVRETSEIVDHFRSAD